MPVIHPSRGTHLTFASEDLPLRRTACVVPAGHGRMMFTLPWMGRTLVGTTDVDYDGDLRHIAPPADDVDYILDALNHFFETDLTPGTRNRRLRRRAAADQHRRPEEVRRHLAHVRAVRDAWRDDHDYRRQAHHLAADGRARSSTASSSATAARHHRRTEEIPLGLPIDPDDLPVTQGIDEHGARASGRSLRLRGQRRGRFARSDPHLAAPIVERSARPAGRGHDGGAATSRHARSATSFCAARGSASLRRASWSPVAEMCRWPFAPWPT